MQQHFLTIIAGKDHHENYTLAQPFDTPPDYTKALNYHALRGARIGIPRNGIGNYGWATNSTGIMKNFDDAIETMRAAGAVIVDPADFPIVNASAFWAGSWINAKRRKVFEGDFQVGINNYLSKILFNGPDESKRMRTIEDVLSCTESNSLEQWPLHDAKSIEAAVSSNLTADSAEVWEAYQSDLSVGRAGSVTGALDKYDLDALVMPSFLSVVFPALGGLPIVTVPAGVLPENTETEWDNWHQVITRGPNIPLGLGFMGRPWSEETLIGLGYAFEQRTKVRTKVVPWIKPEVEL